MSGHLSLSGCSRAVLGCKNLASLHSVEITHLTATNRTFLPEICTIFTF